MDTNIKDQYPTKSNISTLFVLIYIGVFVAITAVTSFFYIDIEQNATNNIKTEMRFANKFISNTIYADLKQNSTLMQIIGQEILAHDPKLESREYLTNYLTTIINRSNNDQIVAIGVSSTDGQIQAISNVGLDKKLPNLRKIAPTVRTFNDIDNTGKVSIGRTYFAPFLLNGTGSWVVPIRMLIQDGDANKAIVSAGISTSLFDSLWDSINPKFNISTYILRDDNYVQFSNNDDISNDILYNSVLPQTCTTHTDVYITSQSTVKCTVLDKETLAFTTHNEFFNFTTITTVGMNTLDDLMSVEYNALLIKYLVSILVSSVLFSLGLYLTTSHKRKLEYQATNDSLTSLPNREALHLLLNDHISKANNSTEIALFFIDLDDFKEVNDTYDHSVGDQLLIEVANRLKGILRSTDFVARLGGDEFVVVTTNSSNRRRNRMSTTEVATQIQKATTDAIIINDIPIYVNSSVGIATFPNHATTTSDLLRKADIAMYESKVLGKNQAITFSIDLEVSTLRNNEMRRRLRESVLNDNFYVLFQPQVCSENNQLIGFESLVRWNDDVFTDVGPAVFIPIIESMNLINELGEFVLDESLKFFSEYKRKAGCRFEGCLYRKKNAVCKISVNVSSLQFNNDKLLDTIQSALIRYDLQPSELVIEVTESALVSDTIETESVNALHELGVGIAIDDFGTGYSSLKKLSTLPVDIIKIDKSFIDSIGMGDKNEFVIDTVVSLSKRLNAIIIAEGVETKEQYELLRKKDAKIIIQGYVIARPTSSYELLTTKNKCVIDQSLDGTE